MMSEIYNCIPIFYLLHIKKRRYYQNYYITHFLLLTRVIKISFFVILKLWYKRTPVQFLQKLIVFIFSFIYDFNYNINYK